MRAASNREARALFATRRLLTELRAAEQPGTCRVCGKAYAAGDAIRSRQWHLEHAHAACGWFRPDELPRDNAPRVYVPIERTRPGTLFRYFEWRCPACGLDACTVRRPRDSDDPRCRRCRPLPELAPGVTVETIVAFTFRVGRGRRPRTVRVETYTRGELVRLAGELALVRWEEPIALEAWARTLLLNAV